MSQFAREFHVADILAGANSDKCDDFSRGIKDLRKGAHGNDFREQDEIKKQGNIRPFLMSPLEEVGYACRISVSEGYVVGDFERKWSTASGVVPSSEDVSIRCMCT